ncbi:oxidoreductase [Janthinobacterium psychrotolerans]|uniref:Short-chain dehydrogenase n=1 Tax=Janthinobacterium psychrotolerans TaxID=1747903 RepID=A0A1A7C3L2_9BURK|nr:oxidoreductase [Janthinobacterium psychrotolerans]OBV38898.1 Short-chain dehydrogenase [Janthinobacterium psychrotolerans]
MQQASHRVAIVTGASSGIGQATARHLARVGYQVFGTSRRPAGNGGQPFEMLALNVTSDDSVEALVREVMRRAGRIDLLVNNAGFGVAPAAAEESSLDQARAIFDTNFFGLVRMTRAVAPHMRAQGSGHIINIGSVLGFLPMPYMALYSASKHAVAGYSEALDHELRTMGVRVSVVEPAYINTPFDANLMAPDAPLAAYRAICEKVEQRVRQVLVGADGPEVVAEIIVKAAGARKHQLRYAPGLAKRMRLLRRYAPASVLDAGVRKDLRLEG